MLHWLKIELIQTDFKFRSARKTTFISQWHDIHILYQPAILFHVWKHGRHEIAASLVPGGGTKPPPKKRYRLLYLLLAHHDGANKIKPARPSDPCNLPTRSEIKHIVVLRNVGKLVTILQSSWLWTWCKMEVGIGILEMLAQCRALNSDEGLCITRSGDGRSAHTFEYRHSLR